MKIKKGTIILFKGDICQNVYKIVSGCLKSYVIDAIGKEHILQFAPEGWYISNLESFIYEKPSTIFIEAVEDTEYLKISRKEIESQNKSNNSFLEEKNFMLAKSIISLNRRLISSLSFTAEERYLEFIENYPTLMKRLPLKLIASFIGVTPEYLSEIRRKIAFK